MNLTRLLVPLALAIACQGGISPRAHAQMEIGLRVGAGGYAGDLAPTSFTGHVGNLQAAAGLYARLDLVPRVSAQLHAGYAAIRGGDQLRDDTAERNLSFSSNLYEVGVGAELYPFTSEALVSPYVFVGATMYAFNPTADYLGDEVELQPLGTEGQGLPGLPDRYALTRFAVPLGVGLRYSVNAVVTLGLHASANLTFFDYLDDVGGSYLNYFSLVDGRGVPGASDGNGTLAATLGDRAGELTPEGDPRQLPSGTPRANLPARNDLYYTAHITIGYRIGSGALGAAGSQRGVKRYNRCFVF